MANTIAGGDLYHLWRVAEVHLPRIADVYYDANRALSGAKTTYAQVGPGEAHLPPEVTHDTDAFRQNTSSVPASAGYYASQASMTSSVGAAWEALRNELQSMYAQVGTTVLDAAGGIRRAMQDFVDADLTSADELSKYLVDRTNHNPNDPASNPPVRGADDHPGEPVLP
ncbi:MAG: hypothetical protein JXA67_02330 [Micromonosporaceae bacterium]|nr:hypothetical protein [Micromonosporaceae bacterium]